MRWKYVLLGSVAFGLLAAGTVFLLRDHLADYWIKQQLAAQLSRALDAEVDLQGVHWKGGVLQAQRLRMAGEQLPFIRLESRGVRAVVDWRRLLEPAKEPLHVEIAEADLVWRPPGAQGAGAAAADTAAAQFPPLDLLVGKLSFRHNDNHDWSIDNSSVRAVQQGKSWSVSANGGSLTIGAWPALSVERLSAEHRDGKWNIGSFALKDGRDGVIAGSASQAGETWSGEFSWQDLDLAALAPPEMAPHLEGTASGDAVLKGDVLRGQMKISGASTKTVSLLVKLASLVGGEDWSDVPWQIFRFDFTRQSDGRVEFSNLQALSPKGIAVRGSGYYTPAGLGADLQVGIRREGRSYLGAFVPILFSHERDGYYWMPVKVGGTLAAPTENLSTRIVAALTVAPAAGAAESAVQIPGAAVEAVGGALRDLLRR
ncbi:MAG: hypothetical protein WEC72_01805 [Chthoniobacterales bacterium]